MSLQPERLRWMNLSIVQRQSTKALDSAEFVMWAEPGYNICVVYLYINAISGTDITTSGTGY